MRHRLHFSLYLLLILLLCTASHVSAQPAPPPAKLPKEVRQYLDRVLLLIEKQALVTKKIDWPRLRREVAQRAQGLATVAECQPVLEYIRHTLHEAGDKHSYFIYPAQAAKLTSVSYAGQPAASRYLENGVGYLKIPEFTPMEPGVEHAFAQGIRRQMDSLAAQHQLTGWVIDLRHNIGGNMYPMLEGVQPLLGEGTYGYFIFRDGERALHSQSTKEPVPQAAAAVSTSLRVAVLLDSLTASSGEMVAIAFKGRPNTQFFGQPSAGYTTSNRRFELANGAYLMLATGYMADRNRQAYLNGITPDVVVEYTPAQSPDKTLDAARHWVQQALPAKGKQ
jgi:carboxyl-terminal processing protease